MWSPGAKAPNMGFTIDKQWLWPIKNGTESPMVQPPLIWQSTVALFEGTIMMECIQLYTLLILLPDLVVSHGLQHWACCVATMQLERLQKTLGKLSVFGLRVCHLQNRCNLWANRRVLPPSLAAVLLIPFAEIFPAASYCFFPIFSSQRINHQNPLFTRAAMSRASASRQMPCNTSTSAMGKLQLGPAASVLSAKLVGVCCALMCPK